MLTKKNLKTKEIAATALTVGDIIYQPSTGVWIYVTATIDYGTSLEWAGMKHDGSRAPQRKADASTTYRILSEREDMLPVFSEYERIQDEIAAQRGGW